MKTLICCALLYLAAACTWSASGAGDGGITKVIAIQHRDGRQLANQLRAQFGAPTMEGAVTVKIDSVSNQLVVHASAADLQCLEALVAQYDQPLK